MQALFLFVTEIFHSRRGDRGGIYPEPSGTQSQSVRSGFAWKEKTGEG
jgi:hypothetical protein